MDLMPASSLQTSRESDERGSNRSQWDEWRAATVAGVLGGWRAGLDDDDSAQLSAAVEAFDRHESRVSQPAADESLYALKSRAGHATLALTADFSRTHLRRRISDSARRWRAPSVVDFGRGWRNGGKRAKRRLFLWLGVFVIDAFDVGDVE